METAFFFGRLRGEDLGRSENRGQAMNPEGERCTGGISEDEKYGHN